jgi:hypothetical protein
MKKMKHLQHYWSEGDSGDISERRGNDESQEGLLSYPRF